MWNLFGRYKGRKVLPSARQMNLIAAILNHVTQGTGIKMDMPQLPSSDSPWTIGVDVEWLKEFVGGSNYSGAANSLIKSDADGELDALCALLTTAPSTDKVLTVKTGGTDVLWGDANDHKHTTSDLTDWSTATAGFLGTSDIGVNVAAYSHTHSGYAAVGHTHSGYAVNGHTHAYSALTGKPDLSGFLTDSDIGVTVQGYSSALTALASNLANDGKVPLSMLTGNISGHSGMCFVTIDNYGNLGHSENDAYDVLMELADQSTVTNHVVTLPFASWASGATKTSVLVGTDSDGDLNNVVSLLTTAPSTDKVLTVKKNGTTVSWEDAGGGAAENPPSKTNLANAAPGTDTINSSSWTAGGSKGVTVRFHTRTMWSGTTLYGFYRDMVFDTNGRLYSVSAETRYTIDSPVLVNWS